MKSNGVIVVSGLILILLSQVLMSLGYAYLMSQRPIDFAHWALLLGALCMLGLWIDLPSSFSKNIGLVLMSIGIGAVAGMCTIDFMLWAAQGNPDLKKALFELLASTPSIRYPFLIVGPGLFYAGICIATYGLFLKYKWQVILVNIGALMIGLGHLILNNQIVPVVGAVLLAVGLISIIRGSRMP